MRVQQNAVDRVSAIPFRDFADIVLEQTEFVGDCGCRVIYGLRRIKDEKCVLIYPCDDHPNLDQAVLAIGQPTSPMYEKETLEAIVWAIEHAGE